MAQIERKVTFDADGSPSPRVLAAGMQGDNHARLIRFAAPEITEGQRVYVVVEAGKNQDKIRLYQDDDGLWGWTISRTAMAIFGNGYAQLQVVDQADPLDIKWQSGRIMLSIGASMDVDADLSSKYPTLIEQMQADMQATEAVTQGFMQAAAQSAAEALDSATDSENSAQEAQQSEDAAAQSAQDAHGSSENAAASAQAAAASQDAAKASEDAAAQSARDAADSAERAAEIVTGNLDVRYVQITNYTADKTAQAATDAAQDEALETARNALQNAINTNKTAQAATDKAQDEALEAATTTLQNAINTNKTAQAATDKAQDEALAALAAETGAAIEKVKSTAVTATLPASGWSGTGPYTQSISVAELPTGGNAIVSLAAEATAAQRMACRTALIAPTARNGNGITFVADGYQPPTEDIPLLIVAVESESNAAATITNALPGGQKQAIKRVELCRFTASGTFNPADYPTVDGLYDVFIGGAGQGGGRAYGAYTNKSYSATGGSGGRIRLIRDIALTAQTAVTIGKGGLGAYYSEGNIAAGTGGSTAFGSYTSVGGGVSYTPDSTDIRVNPYDGIVYGNKGGSVSWCCLITGQVSVYNATNGAGLAGGDSEIVEVEAKNSEYIDGTGTVTTNKSANGKTGTLGSAGGAALSANPNGSSWLNYTTYVLGGAGDVTSGGGAAGAADDVSGATELARITGGAGGDGLVIVYGAPLEG